MRKTLFPLLAAFAVCAAVTAGVIASTARAQPGQPRPMMIALTTSSGPAMDAPAPPPSARPPQMRQADGDDRGAMCRDFYARQAGDLAYLEASLRLTASEQPLFNNWKQVKLGIAKRQADECEAGPRRGDHAAAAHMHRSPLDGMAREEDLLKARLADISAERPVLEAFYNALSPTQKMDFRPGRGLDLAPGMMGHHMFADAGFGPRGMHPPGPPPGDGPPMGPPPPQ